jgi:hypothetical protein
MIDPLSFNVPPMLFGESARKGWKIIAKAIIDRDSKFTEYIKHAQKIQEYEISEF